MSVMDIVGGRAIINIAVHSLDLYAETNIIAHSSSPFLNHRHPSHAPLWRIL